MTIKISIDVNDETAALWDFIKAHLKMVAEVESDADVFERVLNEWVSSQSDIAIL